MNRKHYILVSITIPNKDALDKWKAWQNFWQNHKAQGKAGGPPERLADNLWLLDRDTAMSFAASLICEAEHAGLECKARFLTDDDF